MLPKYSQSMACAASTGGSRLRKVSKIGGTDVRLQAVKTTSKCYLGRTNTAKVDNKSLGMVGREFLTTTMSVNTYI